MKSPFTSARVKKEPVYVALVNGAEASLEAGAPGLIHGVQAGSIPEWNVAQALDILKVRYQYQVPVGSGRRLRGGRVLDFLIYRPVRWLALMVNGRYWHTGKNTDELEVHIDAFSKGERVLLVDDLLATGGTFGAAAKLVEACGAQVSSMACIIELTGLPGRKNLSGYDLQSLITYDEA